MSAASERSGDRLSSLSEYGRGTGGLGRDRRREFLLCWLVREDEDREGIGGVEGEEKKTGIRIKKKRAGGRETSECVTSATAWVTRESPDPFMALNN